MFRLSSLKPAVAFVSPEAIFDRIRWRLVLGEAFCTDVFYSWPGKQVIHSNLSCESLSLSAVDFSVLVEC